jgi:transcriptional regulator with XRE-family HTH domain
VQQTHQVREETAAEQQERAWHDPDPRAPQVPKNYNRLAVVLAHTTRYAFEPQARLAQDVGVSRSTISRIMSGQSRPSFALVERITRALEKALGRPLDPRDLFSPDGTYPTPSGCALCGCEGCMPEQAYDRWGRLRPAFQNQSPGDWTHYPAATQRRPT